MSKKLKLTVSTNLTNIDEESVKTPDFMRRSDLVNFPSPLNSPTSIKHRESTLRIIELDDLRRGLYKKKKMKEDSKIEEGKTNSFAELS
tara:strand:+ start:68 stop:334 length:267 start_codon:yes stop_codon:yes gene_type:complete